MDPVEFMIGVMKVALWVCIIVVGGFVLLSITAMAVL